MKSIRTDWEIDENLNTPLVLGEEVQLVRTPLTFDELNCNIYLTVYETEYDLGNGGSEGYGFTGAQATNP